MYCSQKHDLTHRYSVWKSGVRKTMEKAALKTKQYYHSNFCWVFKVHRVHSLWCTVNISCFFYNKCSALKKTKVGHSLLWLLTPNNTYHIKMYYTYKEEQRNRGVSVLTHIRRTNRSQISYASLSCYCWLYCLRDHPLKEIWCMR